MKTIDKTTVAQDEIQIRQLTKKWVDVWSPKDKPFTGEDFANKVKELSY
ncbi:MAG: hypothetical protein AAF349_08430 [Cyanobacteria bacterium P01_A01_bin.68]